MPEWQGRRARQWLYGGEELVVAMLPVDVCEPWPSLPVSGRHLA